MGNSNAKLISKSLKDTNFDTLFDHYDKEKSGKLKKETAVLFLREFIATIITMYGKDSLVEPLSPEDKKFIIASFADDFFLRFDANGDGYMDKQEFNEFLATHHNEKDIINFVKVQIQSALVIHRLQAVILKGNWAEAVKIHEKEQKWIEELKFPKFTPSERLGCRLNEKRDAYEFLDLANGSMCTYIKADSETIKKYGAFIEWTFAQLLAASSFQVPLDEKIAEITGDKNMKSFMGNYMSIYEVLTSANHMIALHVVDKLGNTFIDIAKHMKRDQIIKWYYQALLNMENHFRQGNIDHCIGSFEMKRGFKEIQYSYEFDLPRDYKKTSMKSKMAATVCEVRPPNSNKGGSSPSGILLLMTIEDREFVKTMTPQEMIEKTMGDLNQEGNCSEVKYSEVMILKDTVKAVVGEYSWTAKDTKVGIRDVWHLSFMRKNRSETLLISAPNATKNDEDQMDQEATLKNMCLNIWDFTDEEYEKRQILGLLEFKGEPYSLESAHYINNLIALKNGGEVKESGDAWVECLFSIGIEWINTIGKMEVKKEKKSEILKVMAEYETKVRGTYTFTRFK